MKIKQLITFSFILLSLGATSNIFAQNTAIPTFYFDNQEGLVEAEDCSISPIESQTFRISSYSGKNKSKQIENLRNLNGVRQSHLINGSLVKLIKGKSKHDYKKVEVTGLNTVSNLSTNRWFSERLDQGYLYYSSLLPAEDYVLKLNKETMPMKMGDYRENVDGLYLKLVLESNFFKLNCRGFGKREYIIFKAYEKFASKPMALIAVYWDETKIFKHITTMTKYQAAKILPNHLEEESIATYFETDHYNSEVDDSSDVSIENDVNITSINSLEGIDNIICLQKQSLNVRDSSLTEVLYKAKLGEK
ncbi:MAG: hypothetical protein HOK38_02980, partial [Flavobacteriaceae bacterium]|nr:hypothetical protein [Flavobacteriaceae bacterium]